MRISINETCLEYFHRRLSEGWKCISLKGHNAILLSPDGIIRPINLLNDVETLRPNGVGTYTNIAGQFPDSGAHWEKVDEASPDEDTTYVFNNKSGLAEFDAYNLEATAIPSGTINSVKVYFRFRSTNSLVFAQPGLRLGANETIGTKRDKVPQGTYATLNESLSRPGGGNWAVSDLNSLQVIIGLSVDDEAWDCRCTQVYVEVDYTSINLQPVGGGAVAMAGSLKKKTSIDTGQGAVTMAGILATIKTIFKAVGSGAVVMAGSLKKKTATAIGKGAVAIVGTLSTVRKAFTTVGQGAVTMAGSLAKVFRKTQIVGQGAVAIAGTLKRKTFIFAGQGAVTMAGILVAFKVVGVLYHQIVGQGAVRITGGVTTILKTTVQLYNIIIQHLGAWRVKVFATAPMEININTVAAFEVKVFISRRGA